MCFRAALSSARAASRCAAPAWAGSPAATATRTFFVDVFSDVRTALLLSCRLAFCRFRLICDLMLAMSGAVYQRVLPSLIGPTFLRLVPPARSSGRDRPPRSIEGLVDVSH